MVVGALFQALVESLMKVDVAFCEIPLSISLPFVLALVMVPTFILLL